MQIWAAAASSGENVGCVGGEMGIVDTVSGGREKSPARYCVRSVFRRIPSSLYVQSHTFATSVSLCVSPRSIFAFR